MNTRDEILETSKNKLELHQMDVYSNNARFAMGGALLLVDTLSFLAAGSLAVAFRVVFLNESLRSDLFIQIIPVLFLSLVLFGLIGLYPGIGISSVEELRKIVTMTTLVVLAVTAMSFWFRNAEDYSRLTLGLTWAFSVFILPIGRDIIRILGIRLNVWGEPVAIIGFGKQGNWALDYFRWNQKLGLRPMVILDLNETHEYDDQDIRVLRLSDLLLGRRFDQLTGVKTALLILSDVPADFLDYIIRNKQGGFDRLILIPNLEQVSSFGVQSFDFGGVLGLEVRHNLLDIRQQTLKRVMDIFLVVFGGLVISPLLLLIALFVVMESHGDPFYGQYRIGKGGKKFKALKFRSMVKNADLKLEEYLEKNPEMRKEWETTFKLKDDPRVTKIGKILRKYSLDEFPQLINVLKGEMSLVGPRPIVYDEIDHYGDGFNPYTWVQPGITGMWQVSGRSDTTYKQRVHLDEYYIRNWSIWLDIYILARTLVAVLRKEGAY